MQELEVVHVLMGFPGESLLDLAVKNPPEMQKTQALIARLKLFNDLLYTTGNPCMTGFREDTDKKIYVPDRAPLALVWTRSQGVVTCEREVARLW